MAPLLTPEQLRAMKASGLSDQEILEFMRTGMGSAAKKGFTGGTSIRPATPFIDLNKVDNFLGQPRGSAQSNVNRFVGSTPTPATTAKKTGGSSTLANVLEQLTGKTPSKVLSNLINMGSTLIQNATKNKQQAGNTNTAQPAQPGLGSIGQDVVYPDPTALPEFQAPNFELRDFTGKANELAAQSYGPQYQAIDMAAQGAQQNYQRSDKITAGLYENLVNQINATKAQTAADYTQAGADQAARTAALQNSIGDTYHNNTQQQADVMAKLGIQEAAPEALARNTSDASFQQASAAQMGEAQQGQIAKQGASQGDYLTNVGNAERTQGVVQRENLLADLAGVLRQYDQQKIGLKGDERSTAQQIADSLQSKDFQLQQANYGGYKDQYNAQVGQVEFGQQQAQAAAQAQQAAAEAAYQRQRDQEQQANSDRNYQLEVSKYDSGLQTDLAKLRLQEATQNKGILDPNKDATDPIGKVTYAATLATGDPGAGQTYVNFVDQFVRQLESNGSSLANIGNPVAFATQVGDNARAKGLDPAVAQRVAAAWWNAMSK